MDRRIGSAWTSGSDRAITHRRTHPDGYRRIRWEERRQRKDTAARSQTAAIAKAGEIVERLSRSAPTTLIAVVAVSLVHLVIDESAAEDGVASASAAASTAAIALALVKLRNILREFMDVRHAPRALRAATDTLVIVMGVSLLGTYLVGRAIA